MHGALGEQLEDRDADIAAPAASPAATAVAAAWAAEAEAATGVEAELEAATRTEAGLKTSAEWDVMAGVMLAEMVTQVFAELASGLAPLLMKGAAITGDEAEAAGRWCEWVGHVC
jgi:hypothetical protein